MEASKVSVRMSIKDLKHIWQHLLWGAQSVFVSIGTCTEDSANMEERKDVELVEQSEMTHTPDGKQTSETRESVMSSSSPQTVMELDPAVALNKCLREPLVGNGPEGEFVKFREHLVYLQQKIFRAYCSAMQNKRFWCRTGVHDYFLEMQAHACNPVQDPQNILTSAVLLLRMVYPPHWAQDSETYRFNDLTLCVAILMTAFKMQTSLASTVTSDQHKAKEPGIMLREVIAQMFRGESPCELHQVKLMEGRIMTAKVDVLSICHHNPLPVAELELEQLLKEGTLVSRAQQLVLRGMLSFFLHAALLHTENDVLENMGLWASTLEIARGLTSAVMTSYSAAKGVYYRYPYGKRVDQLAESFLYHARQGPAGYLRVGPYSIGSTHTDRWSEAVRNSVSRKALREASNVFSQSEV